MRLADYEGEKALEVLGDLIEPVGEILSDKTILDAWKENRYRAIGIAIKNHKKAVIMVLATLDGVPVEEYKCNIFTLPMKVLELLNDPVLTQLFTSQGQTGDANASGSVSENTEE